MLPTRVTLHPSRLHPHPDHLHAQVGCTRGVDRHPAGTAGRAADASSPTWSRDQSGDSPTDRIGLAAPSLADVPVCSRLFCLRDSIDSSPGGGASMPPASPGITRPRVGRPPLASSPSSSPTQGGGANATARAHKPGWGRERTNANARTSECERGPNTSDLQTRPSADDICVGYGTGPRDLRNSPPGWHTVRRRHPEASLGGGCKSTWVRR